MTLVWTGEIISENEWKAPHRKGRGLGMHLTPEYRKFVDDMTISFRGAEERFTGYVDITVLIYLWQMKDTGNPMKPICDALEKAGVLANDRLIRNQIIERHYHRKNEEDMLVLWIHPVPQLEVAQLHREQEYGYEGHEERH